MYDWQLCGISRRISSRNQSSIQSYLFSHSLFFFLSFSCSLKIPSFFSGTVFINISSRWHQIQQVFHLWTSHVIYLNLTPINLLKSLNPSDWRVKEQPRGGKTPKSFIFRSAEVFCPEESSSVCPYSHLTPSLSLPLSPMNRLPLIHPSFMLPHLLLPL